MARQKNFNFGEASSEQRHQTVDFTVLDRACAEQLGGYLQRSHFLHACDCHEKGALVGPGRRIRRYRRIANIGVMRLAVKRDSMQ
jgi:hypothetical protein